MGGTQLCCCATSPPLLLLKLLCEGGSLGDRAAPQARRSVGGSLQRAAEPLTYAYGSGGGISVAPSDDSGSSGGGSRQQPPGPRRHTVSDLGGGGALDGTSTSSVTSSAAAAKLSGVSLSGKTGAAAVAGSVSSASKPATTAMGDLMIGRQSMQVKVSEGAAKKVCCDTQTAGVGAVCCVASCTTRGGRIGGAS
jgi:hypothetical protein